MATCGSDFTNTFRDLAKLSKAATITPDDEQTIQTISSTYSAPKQALVMRTKCSHEDNPQLMQILRAQPEMLRFFGLNPTEVIQEIEEAKKAREDIEKNFDQKLAGYKEKWVQWVQRYKAILQK
jgi:hypothetical protein